MTEQRPQQVPRPLAAELEFDDQISAAIVNLRGEHDISTTPLVNAAFAGAGAHARVVVDLSECTFADSSLIGALVGVHKQLSAREGRLVLVIPTTALAVRRLSELARLAEIAPIHETRTAAVAGFRPEGAGS